MKARCCFFLFSSHFLACGCRFDTFKNEREKMSNYRKGGGIKKMITEDITTLTAIILFIIFIMMTKRIK